MIDILGIKDSSGICRSALLGIISARAAIKNANFNNPAVRTGIISGTTAEAMTNIELYFKDFLNNDNRNEFIESQDWGFSTEIIAKELGIPAAQMIKSKDELIKLILLRLGFNIPPEIVGISQYRELLADYLSDIDKNEII